MMFLVLLRRVGNAASLWCFACLTGDDVVPVSNNVTSLAPDCGVSSHILHQDRSLCASLLSCPDDTRRM
jgi:hypothetical protein